MAEKQGMALVERLMGGEAEPYEQRQKLVRLANAAPDLLAACEALITTEAISPLGECAHQGPPPKSWIKERTAYAKGFNDCLDRLQPVARTAIAAARGAEPGPASEPRPWPSKIKAVRHIAKRQSLGPRAALEEFEAARMAAIAAARGE